MSVWGLSEPDLRRLRDDALRITDEASALAAIAERLLEDIDDMVAAQAEALADAREAEALHPDN